VGNTTNAPREMAATGTSNDMSPGDEAPPGTPGTGENICPTCSGSGASPDGGECPTCSGTGKVVEAIGGA